MRLRILTWNIHKGIGGVDRRYRLGRIVEVLAHYDADVLLLQEVDEGARRTRFHRQVDAIGEALGIRHRQYGVNHRLRKGVGQYGNAILSRWPLYGVHNIDLTIKPKKARGVLLARTRVRVGANARTVILCNLHLGLSGIERQVQLRRFLESRPFHRLRAGTPIVLAGDFNDVWGTLGRRHLEPAGFRRIGSRVNTYPAWLPMRPLDGIFARGDLVGIQGFRSRLALAREASDHLPLVATAELLGMEG